MDNLNLGARGGGGLKSLGLSKSGDIDKEAIDTSRKGRI